MRKKFEKGITLLVMTIFAASLMACGDKKTSAVSESTETVVLESTEDKEETSVEVLAEESSDDTEEPSDTESTEATVEGNEANEEETEEMLDDMSYIADMQHVSDGTWHQYDVLVAAGGYGWNYMVDSAAYLESDELDDISKLSVSMISGAEEQDIIEDYKNSGAKSLRDFDMLSEDNEMGVLSVGGISRTLQAPVMVVWFNQTRVLRFFTTIDDDTLMTKYIETVIRRTFGTEDAMKLAQPVPAE